MTARFSNKSSSASKFATNARGHRPRLQWHGAPCIPHEILRKKIKMGYIVPAEVS